MATFVLVISKRPVESGCPSRPGDWSVHRFATGFGVQHKAKQSRRPARAPVELAESTSRLGFLFQPQPIGAKRRLQNQKESVHRAARPGVRFGLVRSRDLSFWSFRLFQALEFLP